MAKHPSSRFCLKNTNLLSTGFGRLTPFYFAEVNPNERLKMTSKINIQLAPLLAPAFQECKAYVHYYYVPQSVLHIPEEYNAWVSREQRQLAYMPHTPGYKSVTQIGDVVSALNKVYRNNDSGSVVPYLVNYKAVLNFLPDYLRLQLSSAADYSSVKEDLILEPFIAMFKVYLDHYCSTLYKTIFIDSTNADGSYNYVALDYDDMVFLFSYFQKIGFDTYLSYTQTLTLPSTVVVRPLHILLQVPHVMYGRAGDMFMEAYPVADYVADTTNVGNTIEALRVNSAMARYKERKARVGKGVSSFFREFFGINPSDSRIQVSRYLGGNRTDIVVDDIPQTSETTNDSSLGQLAGNGWKKAAFGFGRRYFSDYGYVFGLIYFLPSQAYFNGMDNVFKHKYAEDLYLDAFDSIGDEPVFRRELTVTNQIATNEEVIGYQPRYQRYRRVKNEIHGDFCDSLMYFHQSRAFTITTNLNQIRQAFAKSSGLNRIFNYTGVISEAQPQPIWVFVKNKCFWKRPMRYKPKGRIS